MWRDRASSSVTTLPYSVARRAPTIATADTSAGCSSPRTYTRDGGSMIVHKRAGYAASSIVMMINRITDVFRAQTYPLPYHRVSSKLCAVLRSSEQSWGTIEGPVLHRLRQLRRGNRRGTVQIRDGTCQPQGAVIRASG